MTILFMFETEFYFQGYFNKITFETQCNRTRILRINHTEYVHSFHSLTGIV